MAARDTMADLINLVRSLIGDPAGSTQQFTDDSVQAALDARRQLARGEWLRCTPTPTSGGYEYKDFAGEKYFESDARLTDGAYETVTPDAADYLNGRYTFDDSQEQNLYISGSRYDVYGAAADLVDRWLASLKLSYDFSADGASFSRSQMVENLKALLRDLRAHSEGGGVSSLLIERSDTL